MDGHQIRGGLFGLSRGIWFCLLLVLLTTIGAVGGPRIYATAVVGSGFMAQTLCEGVFISGREPQSLFAEEMAGKGYELLVFFQAEIDREKKQVSASAFGIGGQTAIFREGLGCTLLDGRSESDLDAQAAGLFPASAPAHSDASWPEGDRVELGALPEGIDGQALNRAIDGIFAEPDPSHLRRTRALVVVHRSRIVAERYAPGFTAAMPLIGWSVGKGLTNALIGLRVKDGRLALSDTGLMPEWRGKNDPRRAITLDQLMRMTSGLAFDESYGDTDSDVVRMLFAEGDKAAFAADKPLLFPPGTHFAYSSGTTTILAGILRQTFAEETDYLAYPRLRLFDPLGMRSAVLEPDASGTFAASSFFFATARDFARLGLLFLHDGVWQGTRILPEGWVAYSLTPTAISPEAEYGAHMWLKLPESAGGGEPPMPGDAYYMLGHDEQIVAVVPSRDLVIVRIGLTREGGDWDTARELAPIVAAFPAEGP
ncbi:serine hydrolase [Methyloceanibacter sp.]|uniref:serine hydrolase domain-containing protein n=1 Tax=Methyloceanibacter sp. TaxID=1965321 RepID=UPI002D2B973B|nr:serine hydrolase [Methyloceanibacter sp.]HZP10601.1 serine hydrolase [Methyloceanibacter sp.]